MSRLMVGADVLNGHLLKMTEQRRKECRPEGNFGRNEPRVQRLDLDKVVAQRYDVQWSDIGRIFVTGEYKDHVWGIEQRYLGS